MLWLEFETEKGAIDAESAIAETLSLPMVGVNGRTGRPDAEAQMTVRWAVPLLTNLGTWVIPTLDPDHRGAVEWNPLWVELLEEITP